MKLFDIEGHLFKLEDIVAVGNVKDYRKDEHEDHLYGFSVMLSTGSFEVIIPRQNNVESYMKYKNHVERWNVHVKYKFYDSLISKGYKEIEPPDGMESKW